MILKNSYDVFDTLLARRFINNVVLLQKLESTIGVKNFASNRINADTGTRSIYEIYDYLVESGSLPQELKTTALELEIALENDNSFLILENVDKVKEGDLLISDMYLTGAIIKEWLNKLGFDKQVAIYQSNSDKNSGKIWQSLGGDKVLHYGDNVHSDYNSPKAHGISVQQPYTKSHLNAEEMYYAYNKLSSIALLVREVRLSSSTSFEDSIFFNIANTYNLPHLLLLAELTYRKYKNRNIVFLGRDSQLLQKLYSTFYSINCSYLPFSRKVAYKNAELAVEYLNCNKETNSVFFDMNSTGATWEHIHKVDNTIEICVAIYLNNQKYLDNMPVLPSTFSYITENNGILSNLLFEILNPGNHGSVIELEKLCNGIILQKFGNLELHVDIVKDIQLPVNRAVQLKQYYVSNLRNELSLIEDSKLIELYRKSVLSITNQLQSIPFKYLENLYRIENNHIQELWNIKK